MKKIGRRIYYDKETGNVLVNTGQRQGYVKETRPEEDMNTFTVLAGRERDSYSYIELDYGQLDADFAASNGYRVNPDTKELEFSYPDSDDEGDEPEEDDFRKPLSEEVDELKEENKSQGQDITDGKLEAMEHGQKLSEIELKMMEVS